MPEVYRTYCIALKRELERKIKGEIKVHYSNERDKFLINIMFYTMHISNSISINGEIVIRDVTKKIVSGMSAEMMSETIIDILKNELKKAMYELIVHGL